ncbi:MAG: heme exporter protein CcmD [Gammaproteobacteria bacterium]
MDGDGVYVWPCYLLTLIVLVGNVWVARSRHKALLRRATARARNSAKTPHDNAQPHSEGAPS